MIALEHLHVIHVIHQEGSFRKASEKLFKARSAVSYSVKQVEEYYQVSIFSRDTYRPELTRDGQLLMPKIQQLLNAANEFDVFAKQMTGEVEPELRLSVGAIFPIEKVTGLLTQLKQHFPETILHLNIETASGERMLLDGLVDIGIYAGLTQDTQRVRYRHIDQIRLPAYISNQSSFAIQADMTVKDLLSVPQVVVKSSYKTSPDSGILEDTVHWYVSDHHTKKSIIRSGLGWGRLSSDEVQAEGLDNLIELNCIDKLEVPIYMACAKNKALGPVAKMIWHYFDEMSTT